MALSLPIGETVKLLYNNGASSSSLTRYIKMIKDSNERLELAKKFNCHHIIIDVWKQLVTLELISILITIHNLLLKYFRILHPKRIAGDY